MAEKDCHIKPDSQGSGFFIFSSCDLSSCRELIKIEKRKILSPHGTFLLTQREGKLLFDFFNQENLFLHSKEIRESLAICNEKTLISRLRIKLKGVTDPIPGLVIKIVPVRGQGYYLKIIVDNLWKTQ